MASICVVATALEDTLSRSSLELVAGARALAAPLGLQVSAALLGHGPGMGEAVETLHSFGVHAVYRCQHALLTAGQSDAVLAALDPALRRIEPQVILITADTVGREVAPRLASRLDAVLATEAMAMAVEDETIIVRRQVYGGRAIATLAVSGRPAVLSVKPRALEAPEPAPVAGTVEDVEVAINADTLPTRVQEIRAEKAAVGLEDAQIVVGGGRGVGGREGFGLLEELAGLLGGAVGASRPPADEGWVPITWQIGQTGKSIRPALYLAVGISGAAQHVAGVSGSRTIVAINRDPEAPIFSLAHVGIVGDFKQVVPALIAKIKALQGS